MMASSYLPLAVLPEAAQMGADRWTVVAIGAYLSLALLLRNLTALDRRLPAWAKWLWLGLDFAAWWYSQELTRWSTGTLYAGLMLTADATMLGWNFLRGIPPFVIASLLMTMGPAVIGVRSGRGFWVQYVFYLAPSFFFLYGSVYMAGRMSEERQAANRARKEAELANAHLRDYARQVEEVAVLRERNRVAREVHDTVAHGFTGIIMQLEAVTRLLRKQPEQAEPALLQVQDLARDSLAEVRRSVHALRPMQMEAKRGLAALQRLLAEYSGTTGVKTDLVVEGTPVELPTAHDLCLYRTVQEGLTNSFRHGRATRARVRLRFTGDTVIAAVEDDGRAAPASHKPGMGLVGIRERAEVLGGQVLAGPAATGGFVLQLTLPLGQTGGAATA